MFGRFLLLLTAGAGLAAFAAPDPSSPPDNRRICREASRQLGSHIRAPRRCRTAEQWREEDERAAQEAATMRLTEGQNDGRVTRAPH
ncbi:MAG: hypothetical protein JO276_06110 [Sphingomonadaceae bacterium]|nr:hypothetical protein [Sphingomonadaceae bacterium]